MQTDNPRLRLFLVLLVCFLWGGPAAWAQQKVSPRPGDGISTLLLRYNRSPKRYHDDFVALNKGKLGKGESLRLGETYLIPPLKGKVSGAATQDNAEEDGSRRKRNGKVVVEPLFGKGKEKVRVTSNRLAGACFYVVSGHGGPDPGAIGRVGKYELHEDEYAYDIALRLAQALLEEGAEVHIIIQDAKDGIRENAYLSNSKRETCMGDAIPLNQVQRLQQRCDKINALYRKDRKKYKYCRAIFLHLDSRSKKKQTDVFFYHSLRKAESKRLANCMKETFESKYDKHQPNRGFSGTVSGRNLYVLSHTTPAAVFVELGNIQNAFDQRRFVMNSNRQALAKWMMEGFVKDYKKR